MCGFVWIQELTGAHCNHTNRVSPFLRKAAKKVFLVHPPPLGLVVKRTATNKREKSVFLSWQPLTPLPPLSELSTKKELFAASLIKLLYIFLNRLLNDLKHKIETNFYVCYLTRKDFISGGRKIYQNLIISAIFSVSDYTLLLVYIYIYIWGGGPIPTSRFFLRIPFTALFI